MDLIPQPKPSQDPLEGLDTGFLPRVESNQDPVDGLYHLVDYARRMEVDPRPISEERREIIRSLLVGRVFNYIDEVRGVRDTLSQEVGELRETRNRLLLEAIELRRYVKQDQLTGLLSRVGFDAEFEEWEETDKEGMGSKIAIAYVDLDDLKKLNDKYGHDFGDVAIIHFSKALTAACRADDIVSRPHGDEFMLGLTGLAQKPDLEDGDRRDGNADFDLTAYMNSLSERVASQLLAIDAPNGLSDELVAVLRNLKFSVGGVLYDKNADSKDGQHATNALPHLLRLADARMFKAKQSKKKKYRINS